MISIFGWAFVRDLQKNNMYKFQPKTVFVFKKKPKKNITFCILEFNSLHQDIQLIFLTSNNNQNNYEC